MTTENTDIESFLAVGKPAMFNVKSRVEQECRYKTVIRGWHRRDYIMMDRPVVRNRFFALSQGLECVLRFIDEGKACGFDTKVIDWDTRRHNPYVHVSWPEAVEAVSFRKYDRLAVTTPCTILLEDGGAVESELRDLSLEGCRINSPVPVPAGSVINVTFVLPDGWAVDEARAIVRSTRTTQTGVVLGCQFEADQDCVDSDVSFFITTSLEQDRGITRPVERLLFLEDDPEASANLRRMLEGRGFEITTASGVVDGLFRLRKASPVALFISHAQRDLDCCEICRLVKEARGFERLPVFIYGGEGPEIDQRSLDAGAVGHYATIEMIEKVIEDLRSGIIPALRT